MTKSLTKSLTKLRSKKIWWNPPLSPKKLRNKY